MAGQQELEQILVGRSLWESVQTCGAPNLEVATKVLMLCVAGGQWVGGQGAWSMLDVLGGEAFCALLGRVACLVKALDPVSSLKGLGADSPKFWSSFLGT